MIPANNTIQEVQSPTDKGRVYPPITLALVGAAACVTIYDKAVHGPLQLIELQNVGTGTIKICVNDDATGNVYNRVLAADTGAGNGLGGTFSIGMGAHVEKITAFSQAGSTITGMLVTNKINMRY